LILLGSWRDVGKHQAFPWDGRKSEGVRCKETASFFLLALSSETRL
jgi:hypothetical protein